MYMANEHFISNKWGTGGGGIEWVWVDREEGAVERTGWVVGGRKEVRQDVTKCCCTAHTITGVVICSSSSTIYLFFLGGGGDGVVNVF